MYGGVGGVEPRGFPLSRLCRNRLVDRLRASARLPDEGKAPATYQSVAADLVLNDATGRSAGIAHRGIRN